jgi:hypothetical protein
MLSFHQQQPYPDEFSRFLTIQAALADAQPLEPETTSVDAILGSRMFQGAPVMPLEFKLMYPRRVTWSSWVRQPDGKMAHFIGSNDATPEEELWHRIHAPERGLTPEDVMAYRKSKRGPVAKFFARLKLWPTQAKSIDDYEVPAFLRNQSD